MDSPTAINVAAITFSVMSFLISIGLTYRQYRKTISGYIIPVVVDFFKEAYTPEFFEAQEYVANRLATEHDPKHGVRGLPEDVQHKIRRVAIFYDNLGKLVANGVISERFAIGSVGTGVGWVWGSLGPFVYQERAIKSSRAFVYLEDLAARAQKCPSSKVHVALRLRHYPPVLVAVQPVEHIESPGQPRVTGPSSTTPKT